jgi:hypothetical protein
MEVLSDCVKVRKKVQGSVAGDTGNTPENAMTRWLYGTGAL